MHSVAARRGIMGTAQTTRISALGLFLLSTEILCTARPFAPSIERDGTFPYERLTILVWIRPANGIAEPAPAEMDLPARSRGDLYLGLLFAALSNQGIDRAEWGSACRTISYGGRSLLSRYALLVCTLAALVHVNRPSTDGALLDWYARSIGGIREPVATAQLLCCLDLLLVVRCGCRRFFRIPVGRHAARSRIPCSLLRTFRFSSGIGSSHTTFKSKPVSIAVGVVPNLF